MNVSYQAEIDSIINKFWITREEASRIFYELEEEETEEEELIY